MKNIFLLILLTAWAVEGSVRHVGTGQTYSTIMSIGAALQKGDTIMLHGNVTENDNVNYWPKYFTLKAASSDRSDTLFICNGEVGVSIIDSTVIDGVTISYRHDANFAGQSNLIKIYDDIHYVKIQNCNFLLGGGSNLSYRRLFDWNINGMTQPKRTQINPYPITFSNNYVYGLNARNNFYTSGMNIYNNNFDSCFILLGTGCRLYRNQIFYDGEYWMGGDSSYVGYNYFRMPNGEGGTFDEHEQPHVGWIIEYNVYDGNGHVPFSNDGLKNSVVQYNRTTRITEAVNFFNYSHYSDYGELHNVKFLGNNYWGATGNGYLNNKDCDSLVSRKEAFVKVANFGNFLSANDTLDSSFSNVAFTSNEFSYVRDSHYTANAPNYYTDSLYMFELNTHPYPYSGWTNTLANYTTDSINTITDSTFRVACSLSTDFWFTDPINKDSAQVNFYVSSDTSVSWGGPDESIILHAGNTHTFTAHGLSGSTKYYTRMTFTGLNTITTVFYTLPTLSVTTTNSQPARVGKNLYLSPSGSDTYTRAQNDISHPWKSVQMPFLYAQAGDSVFYRAGTYTLNQNVSNRLTGYDGTAQDPIVIKNYPGESVTWIFTGSGMIDLEQDHYVVDSLNLISDGAIFRLAYDATVDGFTLKNSTYKMNVGGDNVGIIYADYGSQNVLVYNCKIVGPGLASQGVHLNTGGVIAFNSINLTVRNCTISNCPIGIYYKHGNALINSGFVCDSNFIYNCDRFAIFGNTNKGLYNANIIGARTTGLGILESNGGPAGDSNTITNNLFYGGGLSINYDGIGAVGNTVNNNILLKAYNIFSWSDNPNTDGTITNYNTFVYDTIRNRGVTYTLSGWQSFSGKDQFSIKRTDIVFDSAYPDTVREFYNYSFGGKQIAAITVQPQQQTVNEGSSATFSVTATGTNLTYQWRKDGVNINSATSRTITLTNIPLSDSGHVYSVVVQADTGSAVISNNVMLVVRTYVPPPVITQLSQEVTFACTATEATSYQWQVNGVNIPGATNSTYTTSFSNDVAFTRKYRCMVSNSGGTTSSQYFVINVGGSNRLFPYNSFKTGFGF